ncbi:neutrophil cytosol factor 2 [Fusarium phyllophilum]|uniref:Neutrophil cytosol factor 2 n=1 Tax=Fusarium phyllophilum TaxID=47803 RepID=A0A8H5I8T9_9HYPO|nr:neutrophil cytosol factor 2 [Fusarium phyllophilum]
MGKEISKQHELHKLEELPPLSDYEFNVYNRLAVRMDRFHERFRHMWNMLYTAADTQKRPSNLSLKQFIETGKRALGGSCLACTNAFLAAQGIQFVDNLEGHHGIEERYIFPILAEKMPEFRTDTGDEAAAELLQQHEEIHSGMTAMREYLIACRYGDTEFQFKTLKERMDSWGETLLKHLNQEVKVLGAESMRRYWTIEEIAEFPF